jgi:hypothetical protein
VSGCSTRISELLPPSAGFVGSAGTVGFVGSAGTNGFTGSAGAIGFTGSVGTIVDFSVYSGIFPAILVDGNNPADATYDGTFWKQGTVSAGNGYAQGGMSWDASTGAVTVPQAGLYFINWVSYHTSSGGENHAHSWHLYINGVIKNNPFSHVNMTNVATMQKVATMTLNLNANDTIQIFGNPTSSWRPRIYGGSNATYLQVVKISQVGYTGSVGFVGSAGTNGFTGSVGSGFTGSAGTNGFTGSVGAGFTGSAGTAGSTGFTGSIGFTGSAAPLNLPVVNRSTAYTLTAADVGDYVNITTGGVTVPSGVFVSGDVVSIYNNSASSQTITTTAVTCYLV